MRGAGRGLRTFVLLTGCFLLACSQGGNAGDFEDDAGDDEALPPDLPEPDCDPRRADDCPDDAKCSYVVDARLGPTNRCVLLHGDKLEGESCERIGDSDDCANHHLCWAADQQGKAGICVSFCDPALVCAQPGKVCSVANYGLLPLCLPSCDPLAQDCAAGWGCYPDASRRWVCDVDRSGPTGQHGDPCECINCCDPGLACLSGALIDAEGCGTPELPSCCGLICNHQQQSSCPSEAERCQPFYPGDELMLGLENVGTCRR